MFCCLAPSISYLRVLFCTVEEGQTCILLFVVWQAKSSKPFIAMQEAIDVNMERTRYMSTVEAETKPLC